MNVSLVTLLIPVSALVLGCAVLGETVSRMQLVGMLLVGLGLFVIDGRALDALGQMAAARTR